MRDEVVALIDRAVAHLESMGEVNHRMRFGTFLSYVSLQVDSRRRELRDPFLVTAIAHIAWHTATSGKLEI